MGRDSEGASLGAPSFLPPPSPDGVATLARVSLLGAYGVVCAAHDEVAGEAVAIKKISNAFEHATYTKRTLREIRLLRLLQHDNVIRLRTLLPPVKSDGFKDLYIISDLMETDLSSVIKSPQPLSDDHVQFFIYQVLRGVKFLHSSVPPVTHRDLKPRNLLVNSNCDLKICDFGQSAGRKKRATSAHFKARSSLGRGPPVSADALTSDPLSEGSRRVKVCFWTARARGPPASNHARPAQASRASTSTSSRRAASRP